MNGHTVTSSDRLVFPVRFGCSRHGFSSAGTLTDTVTTRTIAAINGDIHSSSGSRITRKDTGQRLRSLTPNASESPRSTCSPDPDTELVFSGRVVQVTGTGEAGYWVTFEVDRLWTGKVPKRLPVYVWELAAQTPRFREGEFYVAAVKRAREQTRPANVNERVAGDADAP